MIKQEHKKKGDYKSDIYDARVKIALTKWELGNPQEKTKNKNDKCTEDC